MNGFEDEEEFVAPPEKEVEKAYEAMLDYVSYQARTHKQVVDKLKGKGFDEIVIEAVMLRAVEFNLVNDQIFAQSWVDSRKRTNGKSRIRYDLMKRGIPTETIEEAFLDYSLEEEEDGALLEAEKAVRNVPSNVPQAKLKQRAAARVMRKGFPPGVAYSAVASVLSAAEAEKAAEIESLEEVILDD